MTSKLSNGLKACIGCIKDKVHCGGVCDCGWCYLHPMTREKEEEKVMDPNQTLADLIDAATDGDSLIFEETSAILCRWLRMGGFAPKLEDVLAILTVKE